MSARDITVQTYKQEKFIITDPESNGQCGTGKWQIRDRNTKRTYCSDIDQGICDNVHPGGLSRWANLTSNREGNSVSTDGVINCFWDTDTLDRDDVKKIEQSSNVKNDDNEIINEVSKVTCDANKSETVDECYVLTPAGSGCPLDIISKEKMKTCSVWTAIQNGWKGPTTTVATCQKCVGGNKMNPEIIDNEVKLYCERGVTSQDLANKQDCLCYSPIIESDKTRKSVRDPVLGKIISPNNVVSEGPFTLWDYMKRDYPDLVNNRGLWYSPCNGDNRYLTLSNISDGEKKTVCDRLLKYFDDDVVTDTLSKIPEGEKQDFLGRISCNWFTRTFESTPKNSWDKYKWYIFTFIVLIVLIFIIFIASYY